MTEIKDDERMDVVILGRTVGTANGWDQVDDDCLYFYDFKSNGKTSLVNADLQWDYHTGVIESIANDGIEVLFSGDIVELLKNVDKDE